jgi:hypothetical protein
VSLIGSLFIVVIYLCYKDLHNITFRLIFYMSLSDILNGVTFFLPSEGTTCYVQAVGNTIFPLSSVLWTSVIAFCLHRIVIKEDYELMRFEKYYLLYAYGLPLLAVVPPAAAGAFGYAQGWCWIRASGEDYVLGSVLRMICFYIPLWSVIIYNISVYVTIIRQLNYEIEFMTEDRGMQGSLVRRLVFYPIILVVCYSVVTAKRIYDIVDPDEDNLVLTIIAWVFQCANGLLNAVAYGYSDTVKERLCSRCLKRDRYDSNASDDFVTFHPRKRSFSVTTN